MRVSTPTHGKSLLLKYDYHGTDNLTIVKVKVRKVRCVENVNACINFTSHTFSISRALYGTSVLKE